MMDTTNDCFGRNLNVEGLEEALRLLAFRLQENAAPSFEIVVCGGYHADDLLALDPTPDELEMAAQWTMTHDVSESFAMVLKEMLRKLGYENVAERI